MGFLRLISVLAVLGLAVAPAALADPPSGYVIGGSSAPAGAAPYVVYIQSATGGGTFAACTGSVIGPTLILTAAHCLSNPTTGAAIAASAISVTTGVTHPANPPANVALVRTDPYYNPLTFQGDAALLVLTAPVAVAPITIATTAQAALYAPGTAVTFYGWGETVADTPSSAATTLQTGTVPILTNLACSGPVQFHPGYTLCTGGTGYRPATCHGDSGGPLVVGTVQIGITSYGSSIGCGIAPDYFTRVSSVQGWIASAMAGAPAPPTFVPPFNPPAAPAATLTNDGVTATFAAPAADPATQQNGFSATLVGAGGAPVATQTLPLSATSVSFPSVQPGSYAVSVVATYTEGSSPAAASAPVALAAPKAKTKPRIVGPNVVGYQIGCKNGTWAWPGGASFTIEWLRAGKVRKGLVSTSYKVGSADVGKKITCRVTLHATTGSLATATSASSTSGVRLKLLSAPRIVGTPSVGSTLQCTPGSWKHTGALGLTLVWRRDSKIIAGAAAKRPRRTLVAADRGHQITCKVSVKAGPQTAWYRTASVFVR